jgi:hypothetical protein
MERHLAAFESLDADAGARSLTLAASTAGFPHPGTNAAANAHALFARAWLVGNLVEFHVLILTELMCLMLGWPPSPAKTSFCFPDHFDQMLNFADHSADRRRIRKVSHAPDLVQA